MREVWMSRGVAVSVQLITVAYKIFTFSKYCKKYAKPEDVGFKAEEKSSDEKLSDDDYGSKDDHVASKAEPQL